MPKIKPLSRLWTEITPCAAVVYHTLCGITAGADIENWIESAREASLHVQPMDFEGKLRHSEQGSQ